MYFAEQKKNTLAMLLPIHYTKYIFFFFFVHSFDMHTIEAV